MAQRWVVAGAQVLGRPACNLNLSQCQQRREAACTPLGGMCGLDGPTAEGHTQRSGGKFGQQSHAAPEAGDMYA